MSAFLFAAAAAFLGLAAALAVIVPGLRGRGPSADELRTRVEAHRRRLAELDAERTAGLLAPADHEEARREVELALARELERAGRGGARRGRLAAVAVGVAAVALGAGLYLRLGTPELVSMPGSGASADAAAPPSVKAMVARLEARLRARPDDPDGWVMLGRSYRVLGRHAEAARAYREALRRLASPQPDLLVAFAEARLLASRGRADAEVAEALRRALAQAPDHPMGLWLAGLVAYQQGRLEEAVRRWERVLETGGAEDARAEALLREQIAEARRRLAAMHPAPSSGPPDQGKAEQKE